MIDVETSIEPPTLGLETDESEEPTIAVSVFVREADDTFRSGYATLTEQSTDEQIAEALTACLRGVAAMRGPGLVAAVERRIR